MERKAWLRERRRLNEERMDRIFAPIYDEHWGATIAPSHRQMLGHFLALCPPRARILDAACGTGKYWPLLLDGERNVFGIDHSGEMLAKAQAKFLHVPVEKLTLQDLAYENAFDGVVCIDAMEIVFPEDWPRVLANFHGALRDAGLLYMTVEFPEDDLDEVYREAVEAGLPVVEGEYVKEGGYHYYPAIEQARRWIESAGFDILQEDEGDVYHHFLARKS